MARPAKRKVPAQSGRVTPKGTRSGAGASSRPAPDPSGRYTPPIPREMKVSPRWVPVLMFTLLGLGLLVIMLNYLDLVPGGTNNWYLLGGLGLILGGIITATNYH
jgi:hypothetical protein